MNPAWALLRLASPQLPIGGYSYSQGLEMAVENGRVQDAASARRWISDQLLLNLARFEAPLLLAHCRAAAEQDWPTLLATVRSAPGQPRDPRAVSGKPADGLLPAAIAQRPAGAGQRTPAPFLSNAANPIWPWAGPWPLAPGRSAPTTPSPPGCGAGWKTNWPC